jgi:hypothetical protein
MSVVKADPNNQKPHRRKTGCNLSALTLAPALYLRIWECLRNW